MIRRIWVKLFAVEQKLIHFSLKEELVSRAFDYGILFVKNLTNGRISFFFYRLSKFITVCYMNMLAVY